MIHYFLTLGGLILARLIIIYFFGSGRDANMDILNIKSAFSTFLVIPLIEEIIFRDYLIFKLSTYEYKNVISCVIFGIVHFFNMFIENKNASTHDKIIYSMITIPIITYMGYVCALQNNILKAIIIHGTYNVISVYLTLFLYIIKGTSNRVKPKERRVVSKRRHSLPKNKHIKDSIYLIDIHSNIEDLWKHNLFPKSTNMTNLLLCDA
jgi:membrane protease YdiL (CAAX protease family)